MSAAGRRTGAASRRNKAPAGNTCKPTGSKSSVMQRLLTELSEIMQDGSKCISAFPQEDDMFSWTAKIRGPTESVYEGLSYKLSLKFGDKYPFEAPTIKFVTYCYHPNVDEHGNICLDTLKERWSSCNSVSAILHSIQSLLQDPNVDSPLNGQAAALWEKQAEYKVQLHSKSSAAKEVDAEWKL